MFNSWAHGTASFEHAIADDASILVEVLSVPQRQMAPIHDEMTDKSLILNSIINEASVFVAEMSLVSGSKVKGPCPPCLGTIHDTQGIRRIHLSLFPLNF